MLEFELHKIIWHLNCAKLVKACGISIGRTSIGNKEEHGGCGKKLAGWGLVGVHDYVGADLSNTTQVTSFLKVLPKITLFFTKILGFYADSKR